MLSLLALRRRIESGEIDPAAAVEESLAVIRERDPALKAFVCVADAPGVGAASQPLGGVAVGVKDVIDTADLPTQLGCAAIYAGWRPRADAAVVTLLRKAGASVAGKTETTAFAFMDPAPTFNPHHRDHTPGGSSAGSAAAVAAGLIPLAVGTQTGGSVIRPASFCGVAAVKPSFRLLPTVGVKTSAWTLDTLGFFGAGVEDVAYALAAVTGRDLRVDGRDAGAPVLGVFRQDYAGPPAEDGEDALARGIAAVERSGMRVVEIATPPELAEAYAIHGTIQDFEMRQALGWEWEARRDDLPPRIRACLEAAQSLTPDAYDVARGKARRARTACRSMFDGVDALLTFSAPGAAPGRDTTGDPRFNRLMTLLGVPCVNVPGLVSKAGLPVGLQVVAPFGRDRQALAAAHTVEKALKASF